MKKFEALPHTAELRLRIYGKTIEELFSNAAEAMADTLKHNANLRMYADAAKKEKIKIKSIDPNSLLVDFLSEILAKSQINKCVYLVSNLKLNPIPYTLNAICIGYPVERFDEDVKAVTYYGVDIKKNLQGIRQTEIVIDI